MQFQKLVTTLLFAVCITACVSAAPADSADVRARDLQLSSLEDCTLQKRWIGLWQQHSYGVMLRCSGVQFFITQPDNLLGHVKIQTAAQALEYVRFFSSADNYDLFAFGGMVELVPAPPGGPPEQFNMVRPDQFRKWKLPVATVRDVGSNPCAPTMELVCGKEFLITRTVIFPDQRVYKIIESVREHGIYSTVSKTLLVKDAGKIGVFYAGDI